jgi:hypothetical protein
MVDNLKELVLLRYHNVKGNLTTTVWHNFIKDIVSLLHAKGSSESLHCLHFPASGQQDSI